MQSENGRVKEGVLTEFLHPATTEMLRAHWDRSPLFVKGTPDKFQHLMSASRFESILENAVAPELTLTFPDPGNRIFEREGARPVVSADKRQVGALRSADTTLAFEGLEHHDPQLADFIRSLKREVGHAGDVRIYGFRSAPGVGVPVHFDGVAVFTLQVSGTKRWRVSREPALPWPANLGCAISEGRVGYVREPSEDWEYNVPPHDESKFLEFTLEPGDLLYLPAGTWHTTEASGGPSLGLSVAFAPFDFLSLLTQVLRPRMRGLAAWRNLPATFGLNQSGKPSEELDRCFTECLGQLKDIIAEYQRDLPQLHARWSRQLASKVSSRLQPPVPRLVRRTGNVESDSVLVFPKGMLPVVSLSKNEQGQEILRVFDGDNEVLFDEAEWLSFGRNLVRTRRFVASEACAWGSEGTTYSWEQLQPMLQSLFDEGVLDIEGGAASVEKMRMAM